MSNIPQLNSKFIDPAVLKIIRTLQEKGHTTYVVGGCVRDLYLGFQPKDFDVATTARPAQVKRLVPGSYVIGRRFRLVLVQRTNLQVEVATFRRSLPDSVSTENQAPHFGDNLFGSPEEDAQRRDFTVNGLFYDPIKNQLIDYCNGIRDLKERVLKMIGDPAKRLPEDPIRILRAIRLAQKIGFRLDENLKKEMKAYSHTLQDSALARRREEFIKFLKLKEPHLAFLEAYDLDILKHSAPLLHKACESHEFVEHLSHMKSLALPHSHPILFLGHLIHSYVRCFIHKNPDTPVQAQSLLEHLQLSALMKNQLNIFKYEQEHICQAHQMELTLTKKEEFKKQGARKQLSLLSNEAFPLALEFAKKDKLLSGSDILFWENTFEKFRHDILKKYR